MGAMRNHDNSNGFISIFGGLDKIINVVADMVENDKDEVKMSGEFKPDAQRKLTGKYGLNIKLGAGNTEGNSQIRALDDILGRKPEKPRAQEPVTDIFEDGKKVTIVAELPDVEEEDVHLRLDGNTVILSAESQTVNYLKKIELKFTPDDSSIKENYSNCIYSVEILEKPGRE